MSDLKTTTTTQRLALDQIKEIQKDIKDERKSRAVLIKKYYTASNIINGINCLLVTTVVGLEVAGIALLRAIVAVLLAIVTGRMGLALGLLSIIGTALNKK